MRTIARERRQRAIPEHAQAAAGREAALVAAIWVAGLLVRLALMPATFHSDLYQIYSRANDAVTHGAWLSWSGQVIIQQVHNLWFLVIERWLPDNSAIWSSYSGVAGIGAQPSELERFLSYAYLGRALFLMKLPYLVADLVNGWLLTRLVEPRWRARVLALWWLNPLVIYTSMMFGRHDSLSIVAVLAAIVLARRGARLAGLILLGLGGLARFFPVFALPFYIAAYRRSWRQALLLAGVIATLWLCLDLTVLGLTGQSPTLTLLGRYPHVRYLISLALPVGDEMVPLLPMGYALLLLWWLNRPNQGTDAFLAGGAATMLLLIALMPFNPQYAIWAVPLLVPWLALDSRLILAHAAQIALYVVWLARWGSNVTWDLFQPLGKDLVERLPDPQLVAAALLPTEVWQPVVRGLFAAVTLWLAWRVLVLWRAGMPAAGAAGGGTGDHAPVNEEQAC
ncbi:hypothetical protein NET02_07030 [Thermomicrobiaceae bacterium CFH 74404]|uniref:DUF2029 domain-containing protein n=1 Tax=Thermalbibacter longus TaxID=2951981 RepID=A0AA42B9V5_9BACT|nr:hypothetical protein [Thermalbibacter longus]MCM8748892.1 hypothetical protein [Thermalbibacter longus]